MKLSYVIRNMLIVKSIACEAAVSRSQVKHTWLENQIINKTEEDVVLLWKGPGWPALEGEFATRIEEAKDLARTLEDGFSPAQLFEHLTTFHTLPAHIKQAMKETVHALYLRRTDVMERRNAFEKAVGAMGSVFERFHAAWQWQWCYETELNLRGIWRDLYQCAMDLRDELDKLPRGIVLP